MPYQYRFFAGPTPEDLSLDLKQTPIATNLFSGDRCAHVLNSDLDDEDVDWKQIAFLLRNEWVHVFMWMGEKQELSYFPAQIPWIEEALGLVGSVNEPKYLQPPVIFGTNRPVLGIAPPNPPGLVLFSDARWQRSFIYKTSDVDKVIHSREEIGEF